MDLAFSIIYKSNAGNERPSRDFQDREPTNHRPASCHVSARGSTPSCHVATHHARPRSRAVVQGCTVNFVSLVDSVTVWDRAEKKREATKRAQLLPLAYLVIRRRRRRRRAPTWPQPRRTPWRSSAPPARASPPLHAPPRFCRAAAACSNRCASRTRRDCPCSASGPPPTTPPPRPAATSSSPTSRQRWVRAYVCIHPWSHGTSRLNLTYGWMQWEAIEDKPTFLLYSGGAVVALWLTTVVVGAINSVPLVRTIELINHLQLCLNCDWWQVGRRALLLQLPKILELVGLGYTGWFVYRYLLFKVTKKSIVHADASIGIN